MSDALPVLSQSRHLGGTGRNDIHGRGAAFKSFALPELLGYRRGRHRQWRRTFAANGFLLEFFALAKEKGIHTVLDTAGQPFTREKPFFGKLEKLMKVTDLLLLDLKEMNPERHRRLTGRENSNILEFARYLSEIGKPVWIRHVLVPERSDFVEDLQALRAFTETLANVERIEVLPYHTMGIFKWENMGIKYPLEGIRPPEPERIRQAEEILGCGERR